MKTRLSRKLRLGIVGGGRNGYIGAVHRRAAIMDGHWEVVAGALSRDPEVARLSAEDWYIDPTRAYSDYRDMIARESHRPDRPDLVVICTTNETHFEIASVFLEAGFHILCEKPLTVEREHAWKLVDIARRNDAVFAVGHCYSAYPMVRLARGMVADGALGEIKSVVAEYASQYGVGKVYSMPWLDDPARSGPSGVVAGTGTHAHHLVEFVTGLKVQELSADLSALIDGHTLEDHATMHLRFDNGARGLLWNTAIALGNENGLSLRVFGTKGGIRWRQEHPNFLEYTPLDGATRTLTRGGFETGSANRDWERTPCGQPEGYQEAYSNLYYEIGLAILAREGAEVQPADGYLFPTAEHGARGIDFVYAALESSRNNGAFVRLDCNEAQTLHARRMS